MDLNNLIVTVFITIVPIIILKYKVLPNLNTLNSLLLSIGWFIISIGISALLLFLGKYDIYLLSIIPCAALLSFYNYFLLKGDIDIKNLPITLVIITIFFMSSLFQLIPIKLFNLSLDNLDATTNTLLTLFSGGCMLLVLVICYFKNLKDDFQKLKSKFNEMFDISLKYWLIGLFGMIISNFLINLLVPQSIAGNEQAVQQMLDATPILTFISAAVLAPIIEELVFRKSLKDIFKTKWLFVLTSGIVFGLLHVIFSLNSAWDLLYAIPYASLGISFAYILQKTDNIYAPIIVHFIHNALLSSISIFMGVILFR